MQFQRGIQVVDPADVDGIVEAARGDDLPVFILDTGGWVGKKAFFDAVRAALPLDPPWSSTDTLVWDALEDSVWEGIHLLDARKVVIVWPDATAFEKETKGDFEVAWSMLRDLADTLADSGPTVGRPTEVFVFIGMASRSRDSTAP